MTETIYENCGCCGEVPPEVTTTCCPNGIPETLYGTFSNFSGACPNLRTSITFVFNSGAGLWISTEDIFLDNTGGQATLTCLQEGPIGGPYTYRFITNPFTDGFSETDFTCSPVNIEFLSKTFTASNPCESITTVDLTITE